MDAEPSMASIGALIGTPARANIVSVLFDGRARTASELAKVAGVSPAAASEHLEKLRSGKLITCELQGRFRFYKLAGAEVAEILEPLVHLVSSKPVPVRGHDKKYGNIQNARMCYDHLAGRLGVTLTEAMLNRRLIIVENRDFTLTRDGEAFCASMGIQLDIVRSKRRVFARQCLDWSERRPHLAGSLGAAFAEIALASGWIKRESKGRCVFVTLKGREAFSARLGVLV